MKPFQQLNCPYFPCAFENQSCRHCYCMFFPCRLPETGGCYIETATKHLLWDCSGCKVIHDQNVVELLNVDPNETNERILREAKEKLKSYLRGE